MRAHVQLEISAILTRNTPDGRIHAKTAAWMEPAYGNPRRPERPSGEQRPKRRDAWPFSQRALSIDVDEPKIEF